MLCVRRRGGTWPWRERTPALSRVTRASPTAQDTSCPSPKATTWPPHRPRAGQPTATMFHRGGYNRYNVTLLRLCQLRGRYQSDVCYAWEGVAGGAGELRGRPAERGSSGG